MKSPGVCLRSLSFISSGLCAVGMIASAAHAQDIGSVSNSLSDSNDTQGLDTDYGQGAGTIGATLQQGVTDATHAQTGSSISPTDDAYVTDAYVTAQAGGRVESVFGSGGGASRGQPGPAFVLNGLGSGTKQFLQNDGFSAASQRSAFVSAGTEAAFNSSLGTDSGPAALTPAAGKARRSTRTSGAPGALSADSDPVLDGSDEDLQLGPVPAPPSSTATAYFATPSSMQTEYQYDDGQTPLLGRFAGSPGQILGTSAAYGVGAGGFPDSTLGLAGLPSEASAGAPPPALVLGYGEKSPFPPVSEGTVFKVAAGVHPSLHAPPATPFREPFGAYEERLVQKRILAGMSASQAESMREGDRAEYARIGRRRRSNALTTGDTLGDTASAPTIR